jgi:hypothetical protein
VKRAMGFNEKPAPTWGRAFHYLSNLVVANLTLNRHGTPVLVTIEGDGEIE